MPDTLSREALLEWFMPYLHNNETISPEDLIYDLKVFPSAPPEHLPCFIGGEAWVIRNYCGVRHPQKGKISEMYYDANMRLIVAVKGVARGEWGKSAFATQQEAQQRINELYPQK